MEKYLTSEQVATLLQVHPFTVLKYLKSGTLEGVKIGRVYRIKESDVEKFLSDNTIGKGKKRQSDDATPESVSGREEGVSMNQRVEQPKEEPRVSQDSKETHEIQFQDDEPKNENIYYKI